MVLPPPPIQPPQGPPLPPQVARVLALLPPELQQAFAMLPADWQQIVATMPVELLVQFLRLPPAAQARAIELFLAEMGGQPGMPGPGAAPPPRVDAPAPASPSPFVPQGAPLGVPAVPPAPRASPALAGPAGMPMPQQGMPGIVPGVLPQPGEMPAPMPGGPPGGLPGAPMAPAGPGGMPALLPTGPLGGPPPPSAEDKIAKFHERQARAKEELEKQPPRKGDVVTLPDGREVARPDPPKWQLRSIEAVRKVSPYGKRPPKWDECAEDVETCLRRYQPRNRRIAQDTQTFYLMERGAKLSDKPTNALAGDRVHTRSQAQRMVDRLCSLTEASPDRVTINVDPVADDWDTRQAAQRIADWLRYQRACDEDAALLPGMPLLPRQEAQVALIQGGLGYAFDVDDDPDVEVPEYPLRYAPLPPSELYPLDHATYHIFTVPLHEARRRFPILNKQVPVRLTEDGRRDTRQEDQQVTVFAGSDKDGLWHWVGWKWAPTVTEELRNRQTPEKWIKKPCFLGMGRCVYQGPFYWGGSAQPALAETAQTHEAMVGYGIITPIRRTLEVLDKVVSALATNVVKSIDPPIAVIAGAGKNAKDIKKPSLLPGAVNYFDPGTKIEPMLFGIASQPDLQQFVNSVVAELQDAMPPVQAGLGPSESGVDRFQQSEQAGALAVDPVINFFETFYARVYMHRCELALRFSSQAADKKRQYFTVFPHFKSSGGDRGFYDELTPKDLERNGARPGQIRVRYDRLGQVEKQAQAERLIRLVETNLKSAWSAMREMGDPDPEREEKRILEEKIRHSDEMVHALGELTLYQLGSPEALEAYAAKSAQQPPLPVPGLPGQMPLPGIPSPNLPSALVQGPAAQAGLV